MESKSSDQRVADRVAFLCGQGTPRRQQLIAKGEKRTTAEEIELAELMAPAVLIRSRNEDLIGGHDANTSLGDLCVKMLRYGTNQGADPRTIPDGYRGGLV
jgi:hypothetical protein